MINLEYVESLLVEDQSVRINDQLLLISGRRIVFWDSLPPRLKAI